MSRNSATRLPTIYGKHCIAIAADRTSGAQQEGATKLDVGADARRSAVAPVSNLTLPQRDLAFIRELTSIAQGIEQNLLEPHEIEEHMNPHRRVLRDCRPPVGESC